MVCFWTCRMWALTSRNLVAGKKYNERHVFCHDRSVVVWILVFSVLIIPHHLWVPLSGSCRAFREGCDSESRFTDSLQFSGWIRLPLVLMLVPDVAVELSVFSSKVDKHFIKFNFSYSRDFLDLILLHYFPSYIPVLLSAHTSSHWVGGQIYDTVLPDPQPQGMVSSRLVCYYYFYFYYYYHYY